MAKLFSADSKICDKLQKFLNQKQIPISFSDDGTGAIRIIHGLDRPFCTFDTLYVDGAIDCETARHLAVKLNITLGHMGQILDFLNIKIRNCSLGCFR